jgi:uncharacterized membrane protein YbaN (DUF454 family)
MHAGDGATKRRHPLLRPLLFSLGWLSVVLGVLGIFLPLLPTTPFLLLAAWCFARSSARFHGWLINHPRLGPLINGYLDGKGIPLKAKRYAISMLWVSIAISAWVVQITWVRALLLLIALVVTVLIARQPTRQRA